MKYKLLVLDIDGTIRNIDNIITEKTKETLIDLQKRGLTVALASGRPVYGMECTAKELKLDQYGGYILAHNGTVMKNCKTGKIVSNSKLPLGYATRLMAFAREEGCDMMSYDGDTIVTNNVENPYISREARVNGMKLRETDFTEYDDVELNKCMLAGIPERILNAETKGQQMFGDIMSVSRAELHFLEIVPYDVNKGTSLIKLAKMIGCSIEETMACGDSYNDLPMIVCAGLGVAMENALPAVKEAADFVTKSCDEDGVSYVCDLFLNASSTEM